MFSDGPFCGGLRVRGLLLCGVATLGLMSAGLAQGQIQQPLAPLPSFEVATVKPSNPNNYEINGGYTYPGGRFVCVGCTLQYLTMLAFDVQDWQVSGGPNWIDIRKGNRYDIEAKPPVTSEAIHLNNPMRKTPPTAEQQLMLRSLLVDRFQLKFHLEQKAGNIYILSRGNKPLKLLPPKDKEAFHWAGTPGGGAIVDGRGVAGQNISMLELAVRLSGFLRCPVVDRTRLAGSYDFEYRTGDEEPDSSATVGIISSMQEIGLKLTSAKGPVETIVIDQAELPSQN